LKAPHRSKRTIFIEFFNFFATIYYGFLLFTFFCKETILELRDNLTLNNLTLGIVRLMIPSTFALILLFFGLLHSWLNGWAELLRFPDR
jgi:sterol O-acyltransferase